MKIRNKPRLSDLYGDVWCVTCEHVHIPTIPQVTFACGDCGFGSWHLDTAQMHATGWPDHTVYALHHKTEELKG